MASPIALRGDFDGPGLRRLAKQSKDAAQARRLLALAEIYDGGTRTERPGSAGWACRRCETGCCASTPMVPRAGRRQGTGNRPKLSEQHRQASLTWWRAAPSRRSMAWCAGG